VSSRKGRTIVSVVSVCLSLGSSCGEGVGPKSEPSISGSSTPGLAATVNRLGGLLLPEASGAEAHIVNLRMASFATRQVEELSQFQSIVDLSLDGSNIDDDMISSLVKLKNLRRLGLSLTVVTSKGVALLDALPLLSHLDLSHTAIHDRDFDCVKRLRGLKELRLDLSQTTMSALPYFAELGELEGIYVDAEGEMVNVWKRGPGTKGLEFYWRAPKAVTTKSRGYRVVLEAVIKRLGGQVFPDEPQGAFFVKLTDAKCEPGQLKELMRFQSIVKLSLSNTRANDEAMEYVARLKNLKALDLSETEVTGKGVAILGALPSLTMLFLQETKVHGDEFECVQKLQALKELWLDPSQTTLSALRHFNNHPSLREIVLKDERKKFVTPVWSRGSGIRDAEIYWKED
jgi:hypothetical protein